MQTEQDQHLKYLQIALDEAKKCTPVITAFCVGCSIIAHLPNSGAVLLSTGYSREIPGNTHAEANALQKARSLSPQEVAELLGTDQAVDLETLLSTADVYNTLEPCSIRTSGLAPCADALIAAKIKRCYIGVAEPDDFVKCEGANKLKEAGIEVIWLPGLEKECLEVARTGH